MASSFGLWEVTVANDLGSETKLISVVEAAAPTLRLFPAANIQVSFYEGSPLFLDFPIGAYRNVEWYKDDQLLPTYQHFNNYFVSNASAHDAGRYRVIAEQMDGTRLVSEAFTVSVAPPPPASVTFDVVNKIAPEGSEISMGFGFYGTPDSIEWYRDDVLLPQKETSFYMPAVPGIYSVRVKIGAKEFAVHPGRVSVYKYGEPNLIITEPTSRRGTRGQETRFRVETSTGNVTCQWYHNNQVIPGATSLSLSIVTDDATLGQYSVKVTSGAHSQTSAVAWLEYGREGVPVSFLEQPYDIVDQGNVTSPSFHCSGDGDGRHMLQWYKDGVAIPGENTYYLKLAGGAQSEGKYRLLVSGPTGDHWSREAVYRYQPYVDLAPYAEFPGVVRQGPVAKIKPTLRAGESGVLTIFRDGETYEGPTEGAGVLPGVYNFSFASSKGTHWSKEVRVLTDNGITALDPNQSFFINLSSRAVSGPGVESMIGGFSLSGNGGKEMLVRGVGPGLLQHNVPTTLGDPSLILRQGNLELQGNDSWTLDRAGIEAANTMAGAFALAEQDAALTRALSGGNYTAQLSDRDAKTDNALIEIYDLTPSGSGVTLTNLSTRALVGRNGSVLIAGLSISGTQPKRVLIRGIGPTLAGFGIPNPIKDPVLTLYHGTTPMRSSDNWATEYNASELNLEFSRSGAFELHPLAADAAMTVLLSPGNYTVHLASKDGSEGVGLIEVYAMPEEIPPVSTDPAYAGF